MITGELHPEEYDILAAQNEIKRLRAILAERDAEIERLRGMALDLSLVPEPWLFSQISRIGADLECCLVLPAGSFLFEADEERYGTGPTPAAALNAAIERTK